jgi:pilus assembly protein CpaD
MIRNDIFRVACLAGVLMAGSCAAPINDTSVWEDGARNHPIEVAPNYRSMLVSFAGGIGPEDAARMDAFVQDYLYRGNGAISISVPSGAGSQDTIRYFGERLAALGVARSNILVGSRDGANGDARVELGYISFAATTDKCGDWSANAGDTSSNLPMPDFGCSVQHNIAAQLADPRDLMAPRGMSPADATRRATVVGKYEKGEITQADKNKADKVNEQSAAVSDVSR